MHRFVVVENFVSREVAARLRADALQLRRQGACSSTVACPAHPVVSGVHPLCWCRSGDCTFPQPKALHQMHQQGLSWGCGTVQGSCRRRRSSALAVASQSTISLQVHCRPSWLRPYCTTLWTPHIFDLVLHLPCSNAMPCCASPLQQYSALIPEQIADDTSPCNAVRRPDGAR